jgi:hypothetical protein
MDAIENLAVLSKGMGGFGYTSKKPNSSGGWTYTYDHPHTGQEHTIETTHHTPASAKAHTDHHATSREVGGQSHATGTAYHKEQKSSAGHKYHSIEATAHSALGRSWEAQMHEHALRNHLGTKAGKRPRGKQKKRGDNWNPRAEGTPAQRAGKKLKTKKDFEMKFMGTGKEMRTATAAEVVGKRLARKTKRRFKGPEGSLSPEAESAYKDALARSPKGRPFSPSGKGEPGVMRRNKGPASWARGPRPAPPKKKHFLERGDVPSQLKRSIDADGRPLIKGGLYGFRDPHNGKPKLLPAKYLFPYLCAFIEEAYEHECKEPSHKFVNVRDLPMTMARAVMHELVQRMAGDTNLRRACTKYKCTTDTIAELLVKKGILKTRSDAMPTDSDSMNAMGAGMLAGNESMAYSKPAPWMQKSDPHIAVGVGRITDRTPENLAHTLRDDAHDPHTVVRKSIDASIIARGSQLAGETPVEITRSGDCPVHARDLHKSQNLWNPMAPCTCGPTPNAYG